MLKLFVVKEDRIFFYLSCLKFFYTDMLLLFFASALMSCPKLPQSLGVFEVTREDVHQIYQGIFRRDT